MRDYHYWSGSDETIPMYTGVLPDLLRLLPNGMVEMIHFFNVSRIRHCEKVILWLKDLIKNKNRRSNLLFKTALLRTSARSDVAIVSRWFTTKIQYFTIMKALVNIYISEGVQVSFKQIQKNVIKNPTWLFPFFPIKRMRSLEQIGYHTLRSASSE